MTSNYNTKFDEALKAIIRAHPDKEEIAQILRHVWSSMYNEGYISGLNDAGPSGFG